MRAYGFIINVRGSGSGYDRKCSPGDEYDKSDHRHTGRHNRLRAHKKTARRANRLACKEGLEDVVYPHTTL